MGGYGGGGDRYTSCSNHCWYIILGLGEFSVKLFLLTPLPRYLSTFKCLMYYDCPYSRTAQDLFNQKHLRKHFHMYSVVEDKWGAVVAQYRSGDCR